MAANRRYPLERVDEAAGVQVYASAVRARSLRGIFDATISCAADLMSQMLEYSAATGDLRL